MKCFKPFKAAIDLMIGYEPLVKKLFRLVAMALLSCTVARFECVAVSKVPGQSQ